MNQEIGVQEQYVYETASPWRNRGQLHGLLQARGEESSEVRNVYDIARRGGDQGNGGSASMYLHSCVQSDSNSQKHL